MALNFTLGQVIKNWAGENIVQLNVEIGHSLMAKVLYVPFVGKVLINLWHSSVVQKAENIFVINLVKHSGEIRFMLRKGRVIG